MLYSKHIPHQKKEKAPYFQSHLIDSTPHRMNRTAHSSSFPNQQNHDRSNIKQASHFNPKPHPRTSTLRDQINHRLQQNKTKGHTASLTYTHEEADQPLSTIRKMLTQDSPLNAGEGELKDRRENKQNRRVRREEFMVRQQKMLENKRRRRELGEFEQLKKDIEQCTFKPLLTPYRRL